MREAERAHARLYDNFNIDAFAAAEEAARAKAQRKLEENNWFGMPAAEPRVAVRPWSFLGPGVREEAARSNALAERPSPQPRHQDEDHDDEESEEEGSSRTRARVPTLTPRRTMTRRHLGLERRHRIGRRRAPGLQPVGRRRPSARVAGHIAGGPVLATPARRAGGVGRAPAGGQGRRRAGLRDARLSRSLHHRRGGGLAQDDDEGSGTKQISIATISVADVLVRVVVVPECWCHWGEEFSQLSQSLTCGFRRPGEQWVLPINYECEDRTFGKCNGNQSSVARGDLLLDMARAVG